jgi:E3 ubiquitin-protein ligase SHPRH
LKSLKNCNNNYFKETIEINNKQDGSCSICITDKIANCQTNCGHNFCKSCIEKWMENKNSCPMCRKNIINIYNLTIKN